MAQSRVQLAVHTDRDFRGHLSRHGARNGENEDSCTREKHVSSSSRILFWIKASRKKEQNILLEMRRIEEILDT